MLGSPGDRPALSAIISETAWRIAPKRSATSWPPALRPSEGTTDFGGTVARAVEVPRAPNDNSPKIVLSVRRVKAMLAPQTRRQGSRQAPECMVIHSHLNLTYLTSLVKCHAQKSERVAFEMLFGGWTPARSAPSVFGRFTKGLHVSGRMSKLTYPSGAGFHRNQTGGAPTRNSRVLSVAAAYGRQL
jgi:hypothetical protein